MIKRILCACLSAVLCVALAACGSTGAPGSSAITGNPSGKEENSVEQADSADMPTLVWGLLHAGSNSPTGTLWPTEACKDIQEAVRENVGVNLEFTGWVDSQAFELALASDDLPDIIETGRDYVPILLNGNHVLAMDEYEDAAPNLFGVSKTRVESMRKYFSKNEDGKFYFWTPYVGQETVGSAWWNGMSIRWDYYKELGYPQVETEDDFLNVVKQAVDLHPETEDGKKVYGVGTFSDGTLWGWWVRGCSFGYQVIDGNNYAMDVKNNNKIISNLTNLDSPVWRDIRYYYKANQMGIFDPDSLTMKGDDLNAKATNGQLVATNCNWYGGNLKDTELAKDPDSLAEYMILPVEGQYNWGNAIFNIGWTFYNGINAKTQFPEEAMKIFDYMNTPEAVRIGLSGKEGRLWDTSTGVPKITQDAINIRIGGGNQSTLQTNAFWTGVFGLPNSTVCADGAEADLWRDPDIWALSLSNAQKDFCEHYDVQIPAQAATRLIEEGKAFDMSGANVDMMAIMPPVPQDISRIDSRCLDIMVKAIPRLVLATDETGFQAIQEETMAAFKAADIQTSYDWWMEQTGIAQAFLDSVK